MEAAAVLIVAETVKEQSRSSTAQKSRTYAWDFMRCLRDNALLGRALERSGVPKDQAFGDPRHLPLNGKVVGLLRLAPGSAYDSCLTQWTEEERLWWGCLLCASDAFSAHVRESAFALAPVEANWGSAEATPHPRAALGNHKFMAPLMAACTQAALQGGFARHGCPEPPQTGFEVLTGWGLPSENQASTKCLVLPLPFALALVHG